MKDRILHSWLILVNAGFLLIYLVLTLTAQYEFSDFWLGMAAFGGLALVLVHLALRRALGDRDLFSIDKLFIAAYFYFHYGYLIPYALGAVPYEVRVFWNPAIAPQAALLITTILAGFLLGVNLRARKVDLPERLDITTCPQALNIWFLVGKLALFGGLGLILLFMVQFGIGNLVNREYGFDLFYSGEFEAGLFTSGRLLFSTGVTVFAAELWLRKRLTFSSALGILALFGYSVIIFVFFGVRSWLMIDVFLPLLLSYHYLSRRIHVRWALLFVFLALVGSLFMEIARPADERSLTAFQDELSYQLSGGEFSVWDLIARPYQSYTRVIQEMSLVPLEKSYQGGLTLLYGFVGSIPELGKFIVPAGYEAPERWLASIVDPWMYNQDEGIGFSMAAEAHINFGIVGGAIFIFLIGLISEQIWTAVLQRKSFGMWLFYLIYAINLMFGVRQSILGFIRPLMGFLLIALLVKMGELIFFRKRTVRVNEVSSGYTSISQ